MSITLKQAKTMHYLKLHVWFDNRNVLFGAYNQSTFINELAQMLLVYREAGTRTEEYEYDEAGNRRLTRITLIQSEQRQSLYYPKSDRLKTDGRYTYQYDNAGNLISKVKDLAGGETAENWVYRYDLLNRLIKVTKNGTIVAEYGYDPEGLRVVKKVYKNGVNSDKIHYVFEGLEPIFEKRISDGRVRSYVYALGNHLARVDGVIGDTNAKKYWYHTDQVGSVKVVTNQAGAIVWNADYLPFGQQYMKNKLDPEFEEDDLGFTGKGYDADVGLYYFNARWYDSDTGRFISEDPVGDPSNPNLYSYCRNNPLKFVDPTGLESANPGNISTVTSGSGDYGWNNGSNNSVSLTVTENPDGSKTYSASKTVKTDSPGVTKTYTTDTTYNADGSLSSENESATYSKKDGGSVIITKVTIGNYQEVFYCMKDKNGNIVDSGSVSGIVLIGLRGWGTGKETNSSNLEVKAGEQNDKYDDMIILANSKGQVAAFYNCNFESTNYKGTYKEGEAALTGVGGDIADGTYVFNYGFHKSYAAFWVNNNGEVDSKTLNPNSNDFYLRGVHIHKGGSDWSWSTGCITIYQDDWSNFMAYFKSNEPTYSRVMLFGIDTGKKKVNYDANGNISGTRNGQEAGTLIIDTI